METLLRPDVQRITQLEDLELLIVGDIVKATDCQQYLLVEDISGGGIFFVRRIGYFPPQVERIYAERKEVVPCDGSIQIGGVINSKLYQYSSAPDFTLSQSERVSNQEYKKINELLEEVIF